MQDGARRTNETCPDAQADGRVALPARALLYAAETALATLGRDAAGLRVVWSMRERAIFFQAEPSPALYIKVYQQAAQLAREVAMLERAAPSTPTRRRC